MMAFHICNFIPGGWNDGIPYMEFHYFRIPSPGARPAGMKSHPWNFTPFDFIPKDSRFDMTELIQILLDKKISVAAFPIHEYWLDIGQPEDYREANDHLTGRDN